MTDVVIVDAIRSPIGALGGNLSTVRPDDLAAALLTGLVKRTGIAADIVEEVYLGCANQAGEDNRNVARMAVLLAGFPATVPAVTFNRPDKGGAVGKIHGLSGGFILIQVHENQLFTDSPEHQGISGGGTHKSGTHH